MAKDLRILIYQEGDLYVGQCLEHDLCVQGDDLEDVRRRMQRQVEFYSNLTCGLDAVEAAPQEFFDSWENTEGDPLPITIQVSHESEEVMVKLAAA